MWRRPVLSLLHGDYRATKRRASQCVTFTLFALLQTQNHVCLQLSQIHDFYVNPKLVSPLKDVRSGSSELLENPLRLSLRARRGAVFSCSRTCRLTECARTHSWASVTCPLFFSYPAKSVQNSLGAELASLSDSVTVFKTLYSSERHTKGQTPQTTVHLAL